MYCVNNMTSCVLKMFKFSLITVILLNKQFLKIIQVLKTGNY